jgi:hypothetical protein
MLRRLPISTFRFMLPLAQYGEGYHQPIALVDATVGFIGLTAGLC